MNKKLLITTSLLLSSAMSFGAGYQINLQGLRQLAMGGTGAAVAWDASTIFYNPGGLSELDHWQAYAGAFFIMPSVKYVQSPGVYTAETKSAVFTPFNVYVGGPVAYKSKVNLGLGIYTPFGSGLQWDDNWRGRYMIRQIELQTIFFQPTISYRVNEQVSVGGGFVYATGSVLLKNAIPLQSQIDGMDGSAELTTDGHGFGFNLGVQVKASEQVQLGFTYRSRVNMKAENGTAKFRVPSSLQSGFPTTSYSTTLPLPAVITAGIGYKPSERLTLQADLSYFGWSAFKELSFDFKDNTAQLEDTHSPRNYKNTFSIRVGGNYVVSDRVSLMLGGGYDPTPVADGYVSPELPDADHFLGTAGITYMPFKNFTVMAAFEVLTTSKRDASFDEEGFSGTYQTTAFTPGIGLSYDF